MCSRIGDERGRHGRVPSRRRVSCVLTSSPSPARRPSVSSRPPWRRRPRAPPWSRVPRFSPPPAGVLLRWTSLWPTSPDVGSRRRGQRNGMTLSSHEGRRPAPAVGGAEHNRPGWTFHSWNGWGGGAPRWLLSHPGQRGVSLSVHTGESGNRVRAGERGRVDTGEEGRREPFGGLRRSSAGDRRVARQGTQDLLVPGAWIRRRVLPGAHQGPPPGSGRRTGQVQERAVGPPRRERRTRFRTALRRHPRQEVDRQRVEGRPQGRRRAVPGDGRRPRGRGHRLAPAGDAETEGAGAPHGVPRDHRARHQGGGGEPEGSGPLPGGRPGDPAHPGPALRLRGQPRAVEEGHAQAVRRPRPIGGDPHRGGTRAGADGLRLGRLLEHRRRPRRRARGTAPHLPGAAGQRRRGQARHRPGLRAGRPHPLRRGAGAGRGRGTPARPWSRRRRTDGVQRRGEALHPQALRALHDVHPATGGRAETPLLGGAHHADRAAPVRERLHHLHADRLDDPVGHRHHGGAFPGGGAVRRPVPVTPAPPVHAEGQERAGGSRGDPPRR